MIEAGGRRMPLTIQAFIMLGASRWGVVLSRKETLSSFLVQQTNFKLLFVTVAPEKFRESRKTSCLHFSLS